MEEYRINLYKLITVLYTNTKHAQREMHIPIHNNLKENKNLGVNLTKEMKNENFKALKKEMEERHQKIEFSPTHSCVGRINTVKITFSLVLILTS